MRWCNPFPIISQYTRTVVTEEIYSLIIGLRDIKLNFPGFAVRLMGMFLADNTEDHCTFQYKLMTYYCIFPKKSTDSSDNSSCV